MRAFLLVLGCLGAAGCSDGGTSVGGASSTGGFEVGTSAATSSSFSTTSGISTAGPTTTGSTGSGGTYDRPVVVATSAIPPVSGGTLLVLSDKKRAVVADPDRDQVVVVDIDQVSIIATVTLQKGDEPGRLVEDGAGRVHVALRGAGSVVSIDATSGLAIARHAVCANPRGIAYESASDVLHVACTAGELVTLKATDGSLVRKVTLENDLRDVVVDGTRLLVSRFRAAEVLVVDPEGKVTAKMKPAGIPADPRLADASVPPGIPGRNAFAPAVAWRMIPAPGGGALLSFQEEQTTDVILDQPGGYGSGTCNGIVRSAVALLRVDQANGTTVLGGSVLPVDLAVNAGGQIAVASAATTDGSNNVSRQSLGPQAPVVVVTPPIAGTMPGQSCSGGTQPPGAAQPSGQVVAIAYSGQQLLTLTRDPMLIIGTRGLWLRGDIIQDTGHELFHLATVGGIACASCHPEGREDGHVWRFSTIGPRRTQSLGGGALGPGPYHWSGDMKDFPTLAEVVFNARMSGPSLSPDHVQALAGWIRRIPAWKPEPATDAAATDRGRELFNSSATGCTSCHGGPDLSTHLLADVGTGEKFKVPSLLGVGFRAPYMHDGCAATLGDRFGACGGAADKHGTISTLNDAQKADLVAYLGTL